VVNQELRVNPFTPDQPVAPELFAGRADEIGQVKAALLRTLGGRGEHILIQGERWMGKSSTALYIENLAKEADRVLKPGGSFFTACCRLGACRDVEEVCVVILDQFRTLQNSLRNRALDFLSQVRGLTIGMFGVQLDRDPTRPPLVPIFPRVFERLIQEARESHNAFLIILDETEHASSLQGMASFLKTLLEQLAADGFRDVMFLMTATPDGVERLVEDHPSFPRLFRHVNLAPMSRQESDELFRKALDRGDPVVSITEEALGLGHFYSDGFPGVLQEIGYSAFDINRDEVIDRFDLTQGMLGPNGVKGAVDTLYDKHFHRILTQRLLSDRYRDILAVVADSAISSPSETVSFREISAALSGKLNTRSMGGYLAQLVRRGVLRKTEGKRGEYALASRMLGLWLRLDRFRREHKGAPRNSHS